VSTSTLKVLQKAELHRLSKPKIKEQFSSEGASGSQLVQSPI